MQKPQKRERFLRASEVYDRVGLKKTAIRKLEAAGDFPRRIKLGERANGWLESEIQAWIEKRVANRAKQVHEIVPPIRNSRGQRAANAA